MIKALKNRVRPDNLHNQVRAGGQSFARRFYLWSVAAILGGLVWLFIGPILFLEADGLVMKERSVVSTDYIARVTAVHVKPGDAVKAGQKIVSVDSAETVEKIADLATRLSQMTSREAQLKSRAASIATLLPVARERRTRSLENVQRMRSLIARQLTTNARVSEATRELFESEKDEAQLNAEEFSLRDEMQAATSSRRELQQLLESIRRMFNEGALLATADGTVGPKVANVGQILKPGDPALEIYKGESYIVGYMPTSRLYSVDVGDSVVVTDGTMRTRGRVVRIESMAEAIPPEFQSSFRSVERQQVMRIEIDESAPRFPIYGKVRVAGMFTPTNVTSILKSAVAGLATSVLRLAGVEPELIFGETTMFAARPANDDDIQTGSVRPVRRQ
ncbi:MAG: HlyD family secretion protein [Beijerinckiaceae bacterium]